MKKRVVTGVVSAFMINSMLLGTVASAATEATVASKEEVIYSTLLSDGTIKDIYSVNIFNVTTAGTITDFGSFDTIKNLTNTNEITYEDGEVSVEAEQGRFYYQGNLSEMALPWNITISYALDGNEISAKDLAGKSGALTITIATEKNDAVNECFYENYMMQVSVTLDSENCTNITAEGASTANSGTDKLLSYTVMPGKDLSATITADVEEFEMSGISFTGIPYSMDIDLGDTSEMSDGLTTLSEAISTLNEGTQQLKEAASKLAEGAETLSDGTKSYSEGFEELTSNSSKMKTASSKILKALTTINDSLSETGELDLSEFSTLVTSLESVSDGLSEVSKAITSLKTGYDTAITALETAIATVPTTNLSEDQIKALYGQVTDTETLQILVDSYTAAKTIAATYDQVKDGLSNISSSFTELKKSVDTIKTGIDTMSSSLSESLEDMDISSSLAELTEGIATLTGSYETFDSGLSTYIDGVDTLEENFAKINEGIATLSSGTSTFEEGIDEYANGVADLNEETKELPDQMQSSIDEVLDQYTSSEVDPVSFVSEENKEVASVQFVITSEAIEQEEVEETVVTEKEEENFFTRLLKLFQ